MIKLSKDIWHYVLNHNMAITAEYLPSVLNTVVDRESRKKTRLFRVVSLSQRFLSGFSTTRFSNNRSICFPSMPSTTSIYIIVPRSLQSGDRCNDTKLESRSSLCISPFQYDFKSAPKNKTGMCSSSDSNCTSLEYLTMAPRALDGGEVIDTSDLAGFRKTLLCQRISENASYIITNSRRKGTVSSYESA